MSKPKAMFVAGVMSGTSADGVDVALARISPARADVPRIEVIGHQGFRYPKAVREAVLRAASGEMKVAELSQLSWRLGEVYADCVKKTCATLASSIDLVGLHGQTVYHQATATRYAGNPVRATWQIGESAVIRERLACPVVSDFRPADLAAGGQGAPLVPMLDYCLFRLAKVNRVLLNLGGIANITVIPAGAKLEDVFAFDTGPANMVVDALMQSYFGKTFDRNGKVAAKGRVLPNIVAQIIAAKYFRQRPPKSCGREQFGAGFVERFQTLCRAAGGSDADTIATATELTAASVIQAYQQFCAGRFAEMPTELVAAGGGVRNVTLMKSLREGFATVGIKVRAMEELGIKSEAKEAVAFALLGWLTWHRLSGNVPSATGARGGRVLGKVSW